MRPKTLSFKFICLLLIFTYLLQAWLPAPLWAGEEGPDKTIPSHKEEAPPQPNALPPPASAEPEQGSSTSLHQTPESLTPQLPDSLSADLASRSISSPPTPLAAFNLAALASFQLEPFTGQAVFSLPLLVPAGRRGLEPNLSLNYASGTGNGLLGIGWNLELGSIERSTKNGLPKYDSTDSFIFKTAGSSQELVAISGGEYRARMESGFLKFSFNGSSWEVTDKSGTKYLFGLSQDARQEQGSLVFGWALEKVIDLQGNYLGITYTKDINQLYPDELHYTGNESTGLAPLFSLKFLFSGRPDVSLSYRSGFEVQTQKRLTELQVRFNQALVRKYLLTYSLSSSGRSLLSSLTQFAGDEQTSLPAIRFRYQEQTRDWKQVGPSPSLPSPSRFDAGAVIVDVNNDSYPDILRYIYYGNSQGDDATFLFNPAASAWEKSNLWQLPHRLWSYTGDQGMRLLDVNNDGWQDVIMNFITKEGSPRNFVYLNNQQDGWHLDNAWSFPSGEYLVVARYNCCADWHEYQGVVLTDVNGDHYPDYVVNRSDGRRTYLHNHTNGWQRQSAWDLPDGDFRDGASLTDLNADGLADLVIASPNWGRKTYLNTSSGWQRRTSLDLPPEANLSNGSSQFADLNADGLVDLLIDQNNNTRPLVYLNTGLSWQRETSWDLPWAGFTSGLRLLDFNADGLADFIYHPQENQSLAYLNPGPYPELLSKVENGLGGELLLTYQPSSHFDNTGSDQASDLPFPIYVVETATQRDLTRLFGALQHQQDITTHYEYQDGFFDFPEREFRGFGSVKAKDGEGHYTQTYFKQDNIFKAKVYLQKSLDASGNLYAQSENLWQSQQPHPGVFFVFLAQSDQYTYDGDSSFRQSRSKFEYDPYGNPIQIISEGEVALPGDEKTQVFEYTYNTTDWLLGLPKYTALKDAQGKELSQKWFYYDEHPSIAQPPQKGLLTKEELWLFNPLSQSEKRLSTTYTYDPYGNLSSSTDALDRTTTTEYDPLTQSYPIRVTNSLNQSLKSHYYGINVPENDPIIGSGLVGQLKSTLDLNQQKTYHLYDPLGRLIKVIGPNDTEEAPSLIYEYTFTTPSEQVLTAPPAKLIQKTKAGSLESFHYLTTCQFFDGLGRLLQQRSPAEPDPLTQQARQVVSGMTRFNSLGQLREKFLPYFEQTSSGYVQIGEIPGSEVPGSWLFTYDPLGRLIQTTNPDHTTSTLSYSDWVITQSDENGHFQTEHSDIYGRIVKIEEHNQGQTYTTLYEYDAQGNLIQIRDDQENLTQLWYDSLGRKLKMQDPDMGTWSYEYDEVGNLIKQTDAKGQVLEFKYDPLNRLKKKSSLPESTFASLSVNSAAEAISEYFYDETSKPDCIGRLSKVTDLSGSTEFFYDNLGREVKSTKTVHSPCLAGRQAQFLPFRPAGTDHSYTVEREYDVLDRLSRLTYPDGSSVRYTYDVNSGLLEKVTGSAANPLTGTQTYVQNIDYSPSGQITRIQYGNGLETTYTYDSFSLRLSNLTTRSPSAGWLQDLYYHFDLAGNIKEIQDNVNTSSQSFVYDDLNRLISASGAYGSFTYDYDSIGNLIYKEGTTLSYGKDHKLPHALTQYGDTQLDYDANGNLIKKRDLEFSYDLENRLTKVTEEDTSAGEELNFELSLGPGWNFFSLPVVPKDARISAVLSSIAGQYSQVSKFNPQEQSFAHYVGNPKFDQFDRLEYGQGYQIYITSPTKLSLSITGSLASGSQLELKTGPNLISGPITKETPVEEALLPLKLDTDYSFILRYNQDLGLFERYATNIQQFPSLKPGESYYLFCLKDTLWTIGKSSFTTTFVYDGDGGRVRKATDDGRGTFTSTTYIGSLYEVSQLELAGEPVSRLTKHVFAGSNRICSLKSELNPLTGEQANPQIHYYHPDHLGSSNVITDQNGQQAQYCEYTPYGTLARNEPANPLTGSPVNHYFTGKELDATGLYFFGARYYDPEIGRFITADTVVPDPSNPQDLNRYTYAQNNPLNYTDPNGQFSWKKFWDSFAGGVVGAIVAIVAAPFIGPVFSGMMAGALGGMTTAGVSGGNLGQGAYMGAAFGFGTGLAGWGVSEAFGNVGRQIFDSSVVLASGAIGYSQGNMEGFLGGIAGSSLVTGIAATATYGAASSAPEAPNPQGFWDTVWDIASFGYSLKQFNDNPTFMNGLGLFADTLALLAPGVPGGAGIASSAVKSGKNIKTFRHYGYAEDVARFKNGLKEGAHATTSIGRPMKGNAAYQRLGLTHHSKSPNAYYKVKVDLNVTPYNGPVDVPGVKNPGVQYTFPKGTPEGSVTGPFDID